MEKISLPTKIDVKEGEENRGVAVIEPCYPGYGLTIGNALRRVLLSSLPGASVVAFKIKGVQHEFSTISGIKEDVVEIMMNLKQLSLKVHSDEPVELALKVKGIKEVKASDISKNSDVEIANLELVICHLTDKSADLEMKIWVEQGLGYIPVEERKGEKSEIGVIQVDAVYTPVQKVGITRENVRVGERTDYDKLTLEIETDNSITAREALKQAAEILVEQFGCIAMSEDGETSNKEIKKQRDEGDEEGDEKDEEDRELKMENGPAKTDVGEKETEEKEKPKKRGRPKKS